MYHGFDINGYHFHTFSRDQSMRSESSRVLYRRDNNSTKKEYYGFIDEIWELTYLGSKYIYLFKIGRAHV